MASRSAAAVPVLLACVALAACGSGGDDGAASRPVSAGLTDASAATQAPLPPGLDASVEERAASFLGREGSALRRSLRRFLGPEMTTKVESGSAICRTGSATPAIADPHEYPFACVVRASADGQGLEVGITLGFVGTQLDGRCWRASNERIAVTTTAPALLTRREARKPVNQISGCA